MKKYTIKSILILAIGCMLHSCLDLDPKDQIADGNYWQTAYRLQVILQSVLWLDTRF